MIGRKFGNRYEIKEKLGSGGMSVVYKGLDTLLNRMVTIKVLREQYASDEDFVRRFHREAQSVASLSHVNIVSIFDVGFEENLHYLVMEFVEGQNLKEFIRQKGKLSVREALPIAMQILDALQHAHENGVVHRDIKPHNILLAKDGRVKVTDFGIARAASETTVTYTGTIVGSVHYISPEQAKGSVIGAKSDIYAAGVVLYEMLTGRLPFTGDSPIAIAMQHIQQEPEFLHDISEEIPEELSRVVRRAMDKDPDQRYESASQMRYDLEKIYLGRAHEIDFPAQGNDSKENTAVMPAVGDNISGRKKIIKLGYRWVFGVIAFLLFLGIVVLCYYAARSFLNVEETTVPQVTGKSLEEAKSRLDEAGLGYQVDHAFDNSIKKGLIISQTIPVGQVVKKERVVGLVVSDGPRMTKVPDIKGKTEREAEVELNNSDLQASFTEEFSEVPLGTVISQDPAAKTEVPENTTVSVVISAGVEPKYITMPGLVKLTLEDAKKELSEKKLTLGKVTQEDSTEYFAWQVLSQEPASGTLVLEGEVVNLVVSQGPGPMADIVRVTYDIPDDGTEHRFQIVVNDNKGEHEEYDRVHQPGDLIVQDVPFYGRGKIFLYLDEKIVYRQNVP